jgi:hypothetical protein
MAKSPTNLLTPRIIGLWVAVVIVATAAAGLPTAAQKRRPSRAHYGDFAYVCKLFILGTKMVGAGGFEPQAATRVKVEQASEYTCAISLSMNNQP